ncbi:MAG: class A beta-lactamase-related serine hydrolase [Clostridiales bacterium]|nr:class A beta-lactamase-related serine hydrolase [Clostridiales bacterium]
MKQISIILALTILLSGCHSEKNRDATLQKMLESYIENVNANIGIAVIIDDRDTVSVNGDRPFPMLSVYKFPIALALAHKYSITGQSLDYPIAFQRDQFDTETYSPMTEAIIASDVIMTDTFRLSTGQLLRYMLQQSDNNASDIILKEIGSPSIVNDYIAQLGIEGIYIQNSEAEMHLDNTLCYANNSTPLAMARLINKFDKEFHDPISCQIKHFMESCSTGTDRIAKPLLSNGAVVGHKTGTGFTLPDGRLMAVNDAGYVHYDDGHCYTIAVFVENSGYDMKHTEALIADISEIVRDHTEKLKPAKSPFDKE